MGSLHIHVDAKTPHRTPYPYRSRCNRDADSFSQDPELILFRTLFVASRRRARGSWMAAAASDRRRQHYSSYVRLGASSGPTLARPEFLAPPRSPGIRVLIQLNFFLNGYSSSLVFFRKDIPKRKSVEKEIGYEMPGKHKLAWSGGR